MANELPTDLGFQDRLKNSYDDEEDTRQITIQFMDTLPPTLDMNSDTNMKDTNNQDLDHTTKNTGDSLNNAGSIDPDSDQIPIRITGVNDQVPNNSTINEGPVEESKNDIDDIEHIGMDDHGTDRIGVQDHNPNNTTEPEHDNIEEQEPRRPNRIRIQNQLAEETNEEFEYINLQGTFGDTESCSPEERIDQIGTPNERQNYYHTIEFIANEARRDNVINDFILTQYSLKADTRKFRKKGCKATMKELLEQMLRREVFGEIDQNSLTYEQKRKTLPVLVFLTLKQDGSTVKGRACVDRC